MLFRHDADPNAIGLELRFSDQSKTFSLISAALLLDADPKYLELLFECGGLINSPVRSHKRKDPLRLESGSDWLLRGREYIPSDLWMTAADSHYNLVPSLLNKSRLIDLCLALGTVLALDAKFIRASCYIIVKKTLKNSYSGIQFFKTEAELDKYSALYFSLTKGAKVSDCTLTSMHLLCPQRGPDKAEEYLLMVEAYQKILQALRLKLKQYSDQSNVKIIDETFLKLKQQAFALNNDFDKDAYCCAYLALRSEWGEFTLPVVREMLELCFLKAELCLRNPEDPPEVVQSRFKQLIDFAKYGDPCLLEEETCQKAKRILQEPLLFTQAHLSKQSLEQLANSSERKEGQTKKSLARFIKPK